MKKDRITPCKMKVGKWATISVVSLSLALLGFFYFNPKAIGANYRYNIIIEKNPFDPERGNGEKTADDSNGAASSSELEKDYAIYGVIISGSKKKAFLKPLSSKDKEYRKVSIGDLVDGWKVEDITDNGVFFLRGKEKAFLKVFGTNKKERSSSRPVAMATPRPKSAISHSSSTHSKKKKKDKKHSKRPQIFKFPTNMKGDENPFLKAIMKAREKNNK